MFFSHYWRRREPPVSLSIACFFSGFTIKVKIYVLFYKGRKFFTGKTNGFFTFLNLYSKKCIGPLKRKVLQVLNRENACFASTIGDGGSRQVASVAAILSRVFLIFVLRFSKDETFFTVFVDSVSPLCIFLMFCFHYWRRRDPPGRLVCGDSFSSF